MLDKIWQEFHSQLLAFIVHKIKDKDAAEDILQDVFIKVHQKLGNVGRILKKSVHGFTVLLGMLFTISTVKNRSKSPILN